MVENLNALYGGLIDLNCAIILSPDSTNSAISRKAAGQGGSGPGGGKGQTGTYPPYIAIQILQGGETHRYRHDLQSLLFMLLWVCCYLSWNRLRKADTRTAGKRTTRCGIHLAPIQASRALFSQPSSRPQRVAYRCTPG